MSKEPKIKPIVIVGAGGMGRDTQWLLERINEEEPTYEILGYIDDGIQQGSIIDGYPILGGMKYLEEYDKEATEYYRPAIYVCVNNKFYKVS